MPRNRNDKQPCLRPQDVVTAIKIVLLASRPTTYLELSQELHLSVSEVYASSQRLRAAALLSSNTQEFLINRAGLREFIIHGVKYAFPALLGASVRGVVTGIDGSRLRDEFAGAGESVLVWPDPDGRQRGISILPFYPKVTLAVRSDSAMYEALALVDVLRAGAAREREAAEILLGQLI